MRMTLTIMLHSCSLLFNIGHVYAQQIQDGYYFLDEAGQTVKEDGSTLILSVRSVGDSCKQFTYYHTLGPLIRTETYKQDNYTIPQGFFAWYDDFGRVDSTGFYDNGVPDKFWYYMNNNSDITRVKTYDKGTLIKDTIYTKDQYFRVKKILRDSTSHSSEQIDIESMFPGGPPGWLNYLNHTERYPDRAINNRIQGIVKVYFSIDTAGCVHDPIIYKSVEVSIDEQALSVIKNSPNWIPGSKNGHRVSTYKIQPIVFTMEGIRKF